MTKRGHGLKLSVSRDGKLMAYSNGRYVVLRTLDGSKVTIMSKHISPVSAAKISPSGTWIASGDETGKVYVWGVETPDIMKNEVLACKSITDICWSFDSKRICAVGDGNPNRGKVFPYDSSNNVGKIDGHTAKIISCDWNGKRPFRLATSGEDFVVAVYDNIPVKYNRDFEGEDHKKYCNAVRYSKDSAFLATCGSDSRIFLYDGKSPSEPVKKMGGKKKGHCGSAIYSLDWSPDSKMIATGGADRSVCIWTIEDRKCVKKFQAGTSGPDTFQVGLAWINAETVMSASLDGSFTFWNPSAEPDSAVTQRWVGHRENVTGMCVSNGSIFTVDSQSRMIRWKVNADGTGNPNEAERYGGVGHKSGVVASVATSAGGAIVTTGLDDCLIVTEAKGAEWGTKKIPVGGYPKALATANASERFAVCVAQGKITVVADGKVESTTEVSYTPVAAAFAPNDRLLAVGDEKGVTRFYDVDKSGLSESSSVKCDKKNVGAITRIAFSPDGKLCASACARKQIQILNVSEGKTVNSFGWEYHQANITCMTFSPKGDRLVTGSMDESFIVWDDLTTFEPKRRTFPITHVGGLVEVAFLNDDTLVTLGSDKAIKTWKL